MPVDPIKKRKVLVIHGVQRGTDKDQDQDKKIKSLIDNRLGNLPVSFSTELYRYEDINDKAIRPAKALMRLIGKTPIAQKLSEEILDIVGDVVLSLSNGSVAAQIREGFKARIMKNFDAGHPCYIVAHSLGSIYAIDVINELIVEQNLFDRKSRRTWPVQGIITIGSPIGLSMFRKNRTAVSQLGDGTKLLRWVNYWDRTDPIVSGNIFGARLSQFEIAESYMNGNAEQGWHIRDVPVDTGKRWLLSHIAYWEDAKVGDGLVDLIAH